MIANDLTHKKKQNQNRGFLSMSFDAFTLFDDVKRKCSNYDTSSHSITASKVIVIFTQVFAYSSCTKSFEFVSFYTQKNQIFLINVKVT